MSGFDDDHENSPFFSRGNSSDVNSRILFIAIVTLSAVVVVVAMLHVYARYMLRRQARRRVALQGLGHITHIHTDQELPKRGLEPTVIASLPILIYKDADHGSNDTGLSHECAVCISSFENGQMIRALPNCKHHFHAECIDKWLGSKSSCPICRHEVEFGPPIPPLPREPSTRIQSGMDPPSAPSLRHTFSVAAVATESTSEGTIQTSEKVNGTNSRLSSFRRMLSMDRSSRQVNNSGTEDGIEDLERQ